MIEEFVEIVKKIVENEISKLHLLELGIVTSVFPHIHENDFDNYECNVRLKDTEIELHKVPVSTQHIGLTNMVHVGDLVLISYINGDINSPVILGRLYNDEDIPPTNKSEEIIYKPNYDQNNEIKRFNMILPGGLLELAVYDDMLKLNIGKTSFVLDSDGKITISSHDNKTSSNINIDNSGNIEIKNNINNNTTLIKINDSGISAETDYEINFKSKRNINFDCSTGDFSIKASNIKIESIMDSTYKAGTKFSLNSKIADIKAIGLMTIEGRPVNIN